MIYALDTSVVANIIVASVTPAPILAAGLVVTIRVANTVTGPTTLYLNGFAVPVRSSNGPISIVADQLVVLIYDGANFNMPVPKAVIGEITPPRTFTTVVQAIDAEEEAKTVRDVAAMEVAATPRTKFIDLEEPKTKVEAEQKEPPIQLDIEK